VPRFHHASAYVQQVRPRGLKALGAMPLLTALAAMLTLSSALGAALLVKGPPRRTDIAIDDEGLHVGGSLAVARDDIASVRLASARSATVEVVPRTGPSLELTLASVYQADEAVAALGRSPVTALRVEKSSPALDRVAGLLDGSAAGLLAAVALGAAFAVISPWLFAMFMAAYAVELATRTAIEVGRDGVLLTGGGKRRFVSFTDVKEVGSDAYGAIAFVLRSGDPIVANAGSRERGAMLLKRIQRCRHLAGGEISDANARQVLLQDDRPLAERLPELRKLGRADQASYRDASVPREQLWRIVEDTTLEASTRVGAAVALSSELADPDRARLRVVAEATASPRTRVALEEVAAETSDDARLEEVLAELETEERGRRRIGE
jgi:hypothetical protein